MIEFDGLPYSILRDIINNVWRCTICNDCFHDIEKFQEHKYAIINKNDLKREFSWIVPVCGVLHLEMNVSKSFVKLNWEAFTNLLGITLGFTSPEAQKYLKKGSEHHKLWHYLEILYVSLGMEVAVPYVQYCKDSGVLPDCNGYWDWCDDLQNANYLYMQYSVFTHLHALMMFRAGILMNFYFFMFCY